MTKKIFNNAFKFLALSLPVIASAQTQSSSTQGFLSEFNYQISSVDVSTAKAMMDSERRDTRLHSICASRAHVWARTMSEKYNVKVGKMFIFLADNTDLKWAYHVVPYTIVNGQEMVLDGGVGSILGHPLGEFQKGPTDVATWSNHYSGGTTPCVVLDPAHNPEHLKLELNIMPMDKTPDGQAMNPLNILEIDTSKISKDDKDILEAALIRKFPGTDTVRCYIRKVPMQYYFPQDIYGADLAMAGDSKFNKFLIKDFEKQELWNACSDALKGDVTNKCSGELGFSWTDLPSNP